MSMVYSKLIKFVPRFVLVLLAAAVITALITFLLIWERVPSYGLIFSFSVFWSFGDSISNTVAASKHYSLCIILLLIGYNTCIIIYMLYSRALSVNHKDTI